jgi:hypothetical protein
MARSASALAKTVEPSIDVPITFGVAFFLPWFVNAARG